MPGAGRGERRVHFRKIKFCRRTVVMAVQRATEPSKMVKTVPFARFYNARMGCQGKEFSGPKSPVARSRDPLWVDSGIRKRQEHTAQGPV